MPDRPILAGSGVTATSARAVLEHADGAIVGTALKEHGKVENPVELRRVQRLVAAAKGTRLGVPACSNV